MRVLFVLPEYGSEVRGGIARFYHHTVSGLLSAGCTVDVCVASLDRIGASANGVPVRRPTQGAVLAAERKLSHLSLFPAVLKQLALAFAAYHECEGGKGYDIVETTDWGLLYVPWLAEASDRPPVVVQLHGSPGQIGYKDPLLEEELSALLTRALETIYLPRSDDLQTSGMNNAEDWQRLLGRKVRRILPAWSTPSTTLHASTAKNFGVVAARLQSWKGPELLCKACRELGGRSPTILWAGGDHPFQRYGQTMSSYLRKNYPDVWGSKIIPLGSQSQGITRTIQDQAGFVVHPSSWDVFGLAVVEAMAAGKVVICSDQAGASCLIEHGRSGFVYPGQDFHQLAHLLEKVSSLDAATLFDMGDAARRAINDNLDVTRITRARLEAYSELPPYRNAFGHSWLERVLAPDKSSLAVETVLLDRMPLKQIVGYLGRRVLHRCFVRPNVTSARALAPDEVSALLNKTAEFNS